MGIGTAAPTSQLEVSGTGLVVSRIAATSGDVALDLFRTGNANHDFRFFADGSDDTFKLEYSENDMATQNTVLTIDALNATYAGNVTASAFVGDGSGLTNVVGDNLGDHIATQNLVLGTTNYLSGDGSNQGIRINTSGHVGINMPPSASYTLGAWGGNALLGRSDGFDVGLILEGHNNGIAWMIGNQDSNNADFVISQGSSLANPHFFIQFGGNIGIGNTNPNALLSLGDTFTTPVGDRSVYMSQDGGDTFFETASGDMSEGLVMHGGGGGTESGIVRNLFSNGFMTGRPQGLHIFNRAAEPIIWSTGNVERMRMTSTGTIGISTSTPTTYPGVKVHVGTGDLAFDTSAAYGLKWVTGNSLIAHIHRWSLNNRLYVTNNGTGNTTGVYLVSGGTSWVSTSDKRLKENIVETSYGLADILKLSVKEYSLKTTKEKDKKIGFLAQEVYEVIPEFVQKGDDAEYLDDDHSDLSKKACFESWGIDYTGFGILAVKAIQEQQEIIESQGSEISELKKEIEWLKRVKSTVSIDSSTNTELESLKAEIAEIRAMLQMKDSRSDK